MPGRHLSNQEKRLREMWNSQPQAFVRPLLESISISGGLRGIGSLYVPFSYPVSVLCGKNGVGKSTVLALAALAFHTPPEWDFPNWLQRPRERPVGNSYFTFRDFFLSTAGESAPDRVSVTWRYRSEPPISAITFNKSNGRWGKYSRRPVREIAFIPMSRLLPAHEIASIRSAFSRLPANSRVSTLNEDALAQLVFVMEGSYSAAEIHDFKRHHFQMVHASSRYSAFNMGGGERWVINLLHTLHTLPQGSLIVIEEIELGLHTQAQHRLAKVLVDVCVKRKLQIICSTHSNEFLDVVPREARVLLHKSGDEHEAIKSPTTRYAKSVMSGVVQPELMIYCEDENARILIEESLEHEVRVRTSIRAVGNADAVIRQCVSHIRSGNRLKAICILDGDVSESKATGKISREIGTEDLESPECWFLPGGTGPEKWALGQLEIDDYAAEFAINFGCSLTEARSMIETAQSQLDPHNLGRCLSDRTALGESECVRRVMRSVARIHPEAMDMRDRIANLLDQREE